MKALCLVLLVPAILWAQPKPSFEKDRVKSLDLVQTLSKDEAEQMKVRIASLSVLVGEEKNQAQIIKLRLNRAKSYLQISRRARVGGGDPLDQLKKAQEDLNVVSGLKDLSAEQKSFLFYLSGLVALDMNNYNQGIGFLNQAIDSNPTAPYSPDLSLFLGDEAYFNEHFTEALNLYSRFVAKLRGKSQIRSLYRIAWTEIKLNKSKEAETALIQLAARPTAELGGFRQDILRDLAGVEARTGQDPEILAMISSRLKLTADEQAGFLRDVIIARQVMGDKRNQTALQERIFALAKTPMDKMQLRLQQLQLRKPNLEENKILLDGFMDSFAALPAKDKKALLAKSGNEIQAEAEYLTGQMAVAFSHKPEHDLAAHLTRYLTFLEGNFHSQTRIQDMRLWLEVCATDHDWACVLKTSAQILKDKELSALKDQALLERISAYEELAKTDLKKNMPLLVQALKEYMQEPKRSEWSKVANRLAALYIQDKKYTDALPVLMQIDATEASEESYYRVELCRFDSGLFDAVIQDARPNMQTERVANLQRESHLRLAQNQSKKGGDFSAYESNLKQYLNTADPAKRDALLKDYFERLEKKHDFEKLFSESMQLNVSQRFDKSLEGFARRLINLRFLEGHYEQVQSLIAADQMGSPEDLRVTNILAQLARAEKLNPKALDGLSDDKRNYILGLLALADPPRVESYLKAHRKASREARNSGLLAAKIESCDRDFQPTPEQVSLLGDAIPASLRPQKVTSIENQISMVALVKPKTLNKASTDKMMRALDQVRKVRVQVSADLPAHPLDVQIRILNRAETLERKAADLILAAPAPSGLTPTQASDYKAQVGELAKEFSAQADQFGSAAGKIADQQNQLQQKNRIPVRKLASALKWPWPTVKVIRNMHRRDEAVSLLAALIDLEFARSVLKSVEPGYWSERAGLLLSKASCQAMVDYVYQELLVNKQKHLLQLWEHL